MEGSKRTATCIGHLSSSTKNKQKTKNILPYDKKFVTQITSNRFKLIMTPTRGKTCGLCRRNGMTTLLLRKPRTVENTLL